MQPLAWPVDGSSVVKRFWIACADENQAMSAHHTLRELDGEPTWRPRTRRTMFLFAVGEEKTVVQRGLFAHTMQGAGSQRELRWWLPV